MIAIDTETWLIGPGRQAPKPVSVQFAWADSSLILHRDDPRTVPRIAEALAEECVAGQNIAFDMAVIGQEWPELQPAIWQAYNDGRVYCTMIAEKMYVVSQGWANKDPRTDRPLSYSLATLSQIYLAKNMLGKDEPDAWRYRYRELNTTPIAEWPLAATRYALDDAIHTLAIAKKQKERFDLPDLARRMRAAWALQLAGAWGLRTDPVAVNDLAIRVRGSIASARSVLQSTGLIRENGTKDLSLIRDRVRSAFRGSPPRTDKGAVSTAKAVLWESGDTLLRLLGSISNDEKLASTYVPVLEGGTRRPICPRWNPLVNTGRTSCRAPNIQNQPRVGGVRECYVPRNAEQAGDGEPRVYVQADYSIAELCSLAQILLWKFGHSKMAQALQAGRELHLDMASKLLGIEYDEAVRRKRDKDVKKARQFAKIGNFGIPGGLGAARLADFAQSSYGIDMTEQAARDLRSKWLNAYPEMTRYFRDVAERVSLGSGQFRLIQPRSLRVRGGVGYTDGCNSPMQGLAADFALDALYHVSRACYIEQDSPLFRARARITHFVHDEIILEAMETRAHDVAIELQKIMETRARLWLPDIPIKAEPCIMRRWSKDAEAFWYNGRLHPFEDAAHAADAGLMG